MGSNTLLGGDKYAEPKQSLFQHRLAGEPFSPSNSKPQLLPDLIKKKKKKINNHCPNHKIKLEKVKGSYLIALSEAW